MKTGLLGTRVEVEACKRQPAVDQTSDGGAEVEGRGWRGTAVGCGE